MHSCVANMCPEYCTQAGQRLSQYLHCLLHLPVCHTIQRRSMGSMCVTVTMRNNNQGCCCRLPETSAEQAASRPPMSLQQLLDLGKHEQSAMPCPFLPFFKRAAASLLKVSVSRQCITSVSADATLLHLQPAMLKANSICQTTLVHLFLHHIAGGHCCHLHMQSHLMKLQRLLLSLFSCAL